MKITIPQPRKNWTLTTWGVQGFIAKQSGLAAPVVNMIWTGKRRATPEAAVKLEAEFIKLQINLTRWDLIYGIEPGQSLPDYYKEKMQKGN